MRSECSLRMRKPKSRSLAPDGRSGQISFIGSLVNHNTPLPPPFLQVFIPKGLKVACFVEDPEVFILKVVAGDIIGRGGRVEEVGVRREASGSVEQVTGHASTK